MSWTAPSQTGDYMATPPSIVADAYRYMVPVVFLDSKGKYCKSWPGWGFEDMSVYQGNECMHGRFPCFYFGALAE